MTPHALIKCLDLTHLVPSAAPDDLLALQHKALTHHPAAVCVFLEAIPALRSALSGSGVKLATVVNFPNGNSAWSTVQSEIEQALSLGVDEIDVVVPYQRFLSGEATCIRRFMQSVRALCPNQTLKAILETGEYPSPAAIEDAAREAIEGGANFLKTSTGKTSIGATLEAVNAFIDAILDAHRPVGIKVSGGIRTPEQATAFSDLITARLGAKALTPERFRVGASQLLDALTGTSDAPTSASEATY